MKNLLESPATDYSIFHYTYDRAGNRRTMTRNTNQDNYTYNKRYELMEVNYAPGAASMTRPLSTIGWGTEKV